MLIKVEDRTRAQPKMNEASYGEAEPLRHIGRRSRIDARLRLFHFNPHFNRVAEDAELRGGRIECVTTSRSEATGDTRRRIARSSTTRVFRDPIS